MSIKITCGPAGMGSSIIIFSGVSSEGNSSANIINSVIGVAARLNEYDSDLVEVIDVYGTINRGHDTLDVQPTHYSQWVDEDDNPFQNAGDVLGYIDGCRLGYLGHQSAITRTPRIGVAGALVGVGSFFETSISTMTTGAIFWDESTFVPGVEVSRFDRRKISGTISSTGTYNFAYTASNLNGDSSGVLTVTVL